MHCIHSIFAPGQISLAERINKNLTCFSVEGAPELKYEKYTGLLPVNLFGTFDRFENNVSYLRKINGKAIIIIPPFANVADFYANFCEYVILRFEGKRKFYKDNFPDIYDAEILDFCRNFHGNRDKILFEISPMSKDCNINRRTFNYFSLSQAKLKQYIKGSKVFFEEQTNHNYYTYSDENNELHILWYEDNDSISKIHNIIKKEGFAGINWRNPSALTDGNWEAMTSIYNHL